MVRGKGRGRIVAIVPAAGVGKRFGEEKNKSFYHFLGKPLIIWTLEALHEVEEISEIIPVFKQDDLEHGSELIERYNIKNIKRIVPGGKERQDSVYNALNSFCEKAEAILIHDGARPLVQRDLIKRAIYELKGFDGVITALPVKDTIKEVRAQRTEGSSDIIVEKTLNRSLLWAVQTPQVFYFDKIMKAYKKAMSEGFYATDDSALIERYNGMVKIIMGSYRNIKITTPEDLLIAEAMLKGG